MLGRMRLPCSLLLVLIPVLALGAEGNTRYKGDEQRGARTGSAWAPAHKGRPASEVQSQHKQCMKICERWTKDCIVDREGNRKCRRSCEQLGEHCF